MCSTCISGSTQWRSVPFRSCAVNKPYTNQCWDGSEADWTVNIGNITYLLQHVSATRRTASVVQAAQLFLCRRWTISGSHPHSTRQLHVTIKQQFFQWKFSICHQSDIDMLIDYCYTTKILTILLTFRPPVWGLYHDWHLIEMLMIM